MVERECLWGNMLFLFPAHNSRSGLGEPTCQKHVASQTPLIGTALLFLANPQRKEVIRMAQKKSEKFEVFEGATALTLPEKGRLSHLELIIEKGQKTFIEVGSALREIRDSQLYRAHGTFEQYCKARWGYARRTAYQLIDSAQVLGNVRHGAQTEPTNERQTRPLASLGWYPPAASTSSARLMRKSSCPWVFPSLEKRD